MHWAEGTQPPKSALADLRARRRDSGPKLECGILTTAQPIDKCENGRGIATGRERDDEFPSICRVHLLAREAALRGKGLQSVQVSLWSRGVNTDDLSGR